MADIWNACQVKINGDLKEEVYVEQPPGFEISEQNMVWRLRKALNGLKQAPKAWCDKIDVFFLSSVSVLLC